jgi:alkaline phosphatase
MKQSFFFYLALVILLASFSSSSENLSNRKPRNIILLIGDGMGVAQIYATIVANKQPLNIEQFPVAGFSKTYSASDFITDSGAGGTAIACGVKAKNKSIGLDSEGRKAKSILEYAESNELATGLVSTSSITHATPASFIAHQLSRKEDEDIAMDFLKTDIDVFIGGGRDNFNQREDKINLVDSLRGRGYQVLFSMKYIKTITSGKLAGLTARNHNPRVALGRGDMLLDATNTAIRILSNNSKGFFLMVEGSMIDWGGHDKDLKYVIEELKDFDKAVGAALEFAKKDGNTLVIVTADHETGGLALVGGDIKSGKVVGSYAYGDHTGVMVPVFAFGPGAEQFGGIYQNTAIFDKMMDLYGFKKE